MTGRWLLDTNVLSEIRKPSPSPKVLEFLRRERLEGLHISTVSTMEIRYGIEIAEDPIVRAELKDWLENTIRPSFENRILPITEDVMLKWRLLVNAGRKMGHTFSQPHLIIAATAGLHGMTIVTRNIADYHLTSVPVFNPWTDPIP